MNNMNKFCKGKKTIRKFGPFLPENLEYIADHYSLRIKHLIRRLRRVNTPLKFAEISKEAFYLQYWIDDMTFFGWPNITKEMERQFVIRFGTKNVLRNLRLQAFLKFLKYAPNGQYVLGENSYVIYNRCAYLRTLRGRWHRVDPQEVFLLLPKLGRPASSRVSNKLRRIYKLTRIDRLFLRWERGNFSENVSKNLFYFAKGVITPEAYHKKVANQIKSILRNPPSFGALEKLHGKGEHYLEDLFRLSDKIVSFAKNFKKKGVYPIYILRDGMMFSEVHTALNFLSGDHQSQARLMIGRKLLSSREQPEFYWWLTVDVLYDAFKKYPDNFRKFTKEYRRLMKRKEEEYPELNLMFKQLTNYIGSHLKNNRGIKKIIMVDTGLQGSVNMLIKYLIDSYLNMPTTDIYMFVVGDWFRGIYRKRFASDYYPMMKDIEARDRSEYLYNYYQGSFEKGQLRVKMGSRHYQFLSNIELIVLIITCLLSFNTKKYGKRICISAGK